MRRSSALVICVVALATGCEALAGPEGSCLGAVPIEATATVAGVAFTDDCAGPSESLGDVYELTLTEHSQILMTMTPTGFKGQLVLVTGNFVSMSSARCAIAIRSSARSWSATWSRSIRIPASPRISATTTTTRWCRGRRRAR